jgi:SAM-dependent methyltransferase
MVADCRTNVGGASFAAADVRALPFADARFDLALAMHMLYELDEPEAAVHDLRRVVRRGGALLASTYSETRPVPLVELHRAALATFGIEHVEPASTFSLENGCDVLGAAFEHIEVVTFDERVPFDADAITELYRRTGRHEAARFSDDDRLAEQFHELARAWPDRESTTTWALFTAR